MCSVNIPSIQVYMYNIIGMDNFTGKGPSWSSSLVWTTSQVKVRRDDSNN